VLGESVIGSQTPDATLPVEPSVSIKITEPQANQTLSIGNTYDIKWTSTNLSSSAQLHIVLVWVSGFDIRAGYIVKNTTNSGSYSWNTSNALAKVDDLTGSDIFSHLDKIVAGGGYAIAITTPDESKYGSSGGFTFIRPGVAAPTVELKVNGSSEQQTLAEGAEFTGSWTAQNATYCEGAGDDLLLKEGGVWNTQKNLPASGSKVLLMKLQDPASWSSYYFRITCFNSYGDYATDTNDIFLDKAQTQVSVELIQPQGGEVIKKGESYVISWTSKNYTGKVDIYVYGDAEDTLAYVDGYIAKGLPASGSYTWDTNKDLSGFTGSALTLQPGKYHMYVVTAEGSYDTTANPITITSGVAETNVHRPVGHLDTIEYDGLIRGWAADPDKLTRSVEIHIYYDNMPGAKPQVLQAYDQRPDVSVKYAGNHGFQTFVPSQYMDFKTHIAYVYAIDVNNKDQHTLLNPGGTKFRLGDLEITDGYFGYMRDGMVFNDRGTFYVIEYGLKRPISSMSVFKGLGYHPNNLYIANLPSVIMGAAVNKSTQRHTRGTLVSDKGTVYFMGRDYKYPFPSEAVFLSWKNRFAEVVPANSADLAVPTGPFVQMYQPPVYEETN
jgi:hypothetical protein